MFFIFVTFRLFFRFEIPSLYLREKSGQNRSTSALLRDFREPSVCSRASSGADTAEIDEKDGNEKFGSQLIKAGSLSSLGTR